MTTFVLSPYVATTAASASATPASSSTVVSMPWPRTKPTAPARPETREGILRLVHDGHVPTVGRESLRDG